MKARQLICLLVIIVTLLSCGFSTSETVLLNTKKGVKKIDNILKTEFKELSKISSLTINTKNKTSNIVDQISVTFNKNNKNALWFYSFGLQKLFKSELDKNNHKEPTPSLKFSAFSIEDIIKNFNKSVEMVNEQTTEFTDFKLSSYAMDIDPESKNIIHSFTLIATKKDNKTSFYGKRIKDNVFSFDFFTNNKGKLVCKNGLNVFKK